MRGRIVLFNNRNEICSTLLSERNISSSILRFSWIPQDAHVFDFEEVIGHHFENNFYNWTTFHYKNMGILNYPRKSTLR